MGQAAMDEVVSVALVPEMVGGQPPRRTGDKSSPFPKYLILKANSRAGVIKYPGPLLVSVPGFGVPGLPGSATTHNLEDFETNGNTGTERDEYFCTVGYHPTPPVSAPQDIQYGYTFFRWQSWTLAYPST